MTTTLTAPAAGTTSLSGEKTPPAQRYQNNVHVYAEARRRAAGFVTSVAITTVLLAVAALADVFLAIPAFNGVLGQSPLLSLICGIAFVAIAIGAAVTAGRELKRGDRRVTYAAAVAVGLLIAGLLVLRITAAGINASATAFEGATQDTDGALAEVPVAIVFAALMLATSILAALDGYLLTLSPTVKSLRILDAEQQRLSAEIATSEAEDARLVENVAIAEERITHLDDDLQHALSGLQAFARELQELARTEVARSLGKPTVTSGLDIPLTRPATIDVKESPNA